MCVGCSMLIIDECGCCYYCNRVKIFEIPIRIAAIGCQYNDHKLDEKKHSLEVNKKYYEGMGKHLPATVKYFQEKGLVDENGKWIQEKSED